MSKQPGLVWNIVRIACIVIIGLLGFAPASAQVKPPPRQPAKNPPSTQLPGSPESSPALKAGTASAAPTTEWTLHKTTDNLHPSDLEQQMVWLMNRARSNPHAEGAWLANSSDPEFAGDRDFFGVDKALLQSQFDSYTAMPPAAFDQRLYLAAKAHSDDLIVRDAQDHTGQMDLIAANGFSLQAYRGNVFSYARSALNAHAAFNIDWGDGTGGMQDSLGHRKAIMAIDRNYTNVGLAVVVVTDTAKSVGPYVVTGNYCIAQTGALHLDQFNQFIVGTVWRDIDWDGMYDPGEGIGGVTVTPSAGTYYAITANSGGYAIPVTMAAGTYPVSFVGGTINASESVTIGSLSVLLDYQVMPNFTDFVYLPVTLK